jgi:hypothetical protein
VSTSARRKTAVSWELHFVEELSLSFWRAQYKMTAFDFVTFKKGQNPAALHKRHNRFIYVTAAADLNVAEFYLQFFYFLSWLAKAFSNHRIC